MVDISYQKGEPMGGDLPKMKSAKKSPVFMVAAAKDPNAANLDRVQIVKGWVDNKGERQERIYDVAVSGGRKIDGSGQGTVSLRANGQVSFHQTLLWMSLKTN